MKVSSTSIPWMIIALVALVGCAEGDGVSQDATSTQVAALTDAEAAALEACLQEIAECRATSESEAEFMESCRDLMECLPDRPDAERRSANWRAFCEEIEEECDDIDLDGVTCEDVLERCEASALSEDQGAWQDQGDLPTQEECLADCLASGEATEEQCGERCAMMPTP